jgi:hypothetical protein
MTSNDATIEVANAAKYSRRVAGRDRPWRRRHPDQRAREPIVYLRSKGLHR